MLYDNTKNLTVEMSASNRPELAFAKAVVRHDITFEYSDDGRVWKKGRAELDHIKELAKAISPERAASIWNMHMDNTFDAEEAPRWYWRG